MELLGSIQTWRNGEGEKERLSSLLVWKKVLGKGKQIRQEIPKQYMVQTGYF